ncbi:MAG: hypothetical protein NTV93_07665 [Verrucomicrobia bacterium]|nr:hypothetical protein [Verrucomicrobiota bacterium]
MGQVIKSVPLAVVAYLRLAAGLAGQIRSGAIKSGEKLTPVLVERDLFSSRQAVPVV